MENIYKKYRKLAGLTQEKAAEHLNISVDTIKRYENGTYIPQNDIARRMCLLYGDMKLAYEHLENSQVGAMVLPPLKDKDLCCSTLGFLSQLSEVTDRQGELISMAADGVIDSHEIESWEELEELLKRLVKSSFELLYRRKNNDKD